MSDRPILIAYDGSEFAQAAIEQAAAQLKNGRRAIVLTVWQLYSGGFAATVGVVPEGMREQVEDDARGVAEEGARLAREAGFDAEPVVESGDSVWRRIVDSADERDADILVLGSHGRTGLPHLLIGSVAERVASHTERPVLIAHARPSAVRL
jgi:nucleotide-binding universal stress UspA family protein